VEQPRSLTAFKAFEAVARTGSVTHAARDLGTTKSAISVSISRLEEQLGYKLLDREPTGRISPRVMLSDRGVVLLPHVRQALQALENGLAAASQ
jgi:molybdate transport repressor ModE-like protein